VGRPELPASDLVRALGLAEVDTDRFRGENVRGAQTVVFGGQLLGQAIAAAAVTVPGMHVKSMHTLFLRGASPEAPVELRTERLHEGRTFASVQVTITQGARLCTTSLVLLDRTDGDLISHQDHPPSVAPPEESRAGASDIEGWDVRFVDGVDIADPDAVGPAELFVWSRFGGVPPEEWIDQALLAYASDGFLIGTAMRPHPAVGQSLAHVSISTSVISQTLTFHDAFSASDWLLLAHRSPFAGRGRSFGRADVFTIDGRMVASFSQENMIRAFNEGATPTPRDPAKQ
jgi:acyl-CoA thioesterase-2